MAAAPPASAECLLLTAHPDGRVLGQIGVRPANPTFTITIVHSVTRTPVVERYRVDGASIVQTAIVFSQHGPGLPTEADADGAWSREGDRFVVTMARRFGTIAMRVHAAQSPRLAVAGDPLPVDLAQWGNRAIALGARAGACPAGPQDGARGAR
ncbi:MAG: DUF1850 domain-containing protein [Betaproteobacteria bacterium]